MRFLAASLFLVSFILLSQGLDRFFPADFHDRGSTEMQRILAADQLDAPYFDFSATTPKTAKEKHLFWASDVWTNSPHLSRGVGLKALEQPDLFAAFFPGYPAEMRHHHGLWRRYFKQSFQITTFLEKLSTLSGHGIMVNLPSTACFEIFKEYGADVLIFGSSETYRGLVIDALSSRLLTNPDGHRPRVLMCTISNMTADSVALFARKLKEISPYRAKSVLWGYGFWNAYVEAPEIQTNYADVVVSVNTYETAALFQDVDYKLSEFFPGLSWDLLMKTSWDKWKSAKPQKVTAIEAEVAIDDALAKDESSLREAIQSRGHTDFPLFHGATDAICQLKGAGASLDRALSALAALSDQTFLFMTPMTPEQSNAAPPCYLGKVRDLLASRAAKTVHVKTEGMAGYGLGYVDFVRPNLNQPGTQFFDDHHTSYSGAMKITTRLAQWMNTQGRSGR
jgi:hypothetical protein